MTRSLVRLLLLLSALPACNRDKAPEPPNVFEAFPNLILPPDAKFVSKSGGAGALQVTFSSPGTAAQVADYYRESLTRSNWQLVADSEDQSGTTTIFAEKDRRPFWIRISADSASGGALVQLTGAAVVSADSAAAAKK